MTSLIASSSKTNSSIARLKLDQIKWRKFCRTITSTKQKKSLHIYRSGSIWRLFVSYSSQRIVTQTLGAEFTQNCSNETFTVLVTNEPKVLWERRWISHFNNQAGRQSEERPLTEMNLHLGLAHQSRATRAKLRQLDETLNQLSWLLFFSFSFFHLLGGRAHVVSLCRLPCFNQNLLGASIKW